MKKLILYIFAFLFYIAAFAQEDKFSIGVFALKSNLMSVGAQLELIYVIK